MDVELGAAIEAAAEQQGRVKEDAKALQKAMAEEAQAQEELRTAAVEAGAAAAADSDVWEECRKAQPLRLLDGSFARPTPRLCYGKARAEAADEKVEECLNGLQTGLREVVNSAQKFDTDVTPNAAKWWRFRYEYSYVEAMIMLAIVPIMVLYKFIHARIRAYQRSMVKSHWFSALSQEIESMHIAWFQFAVAEMFLCFCVAITIWCMFTFRLFDFLFVHIHDDSVHMPTSPEHYQVLAVNICMQLGLAVFAYHVLVYSMVRATVAKFQTWDAYASAQADGEGEHSRPSMYQTLQRGPTLMGGPFEFAQMKDYFTSTVERYPRLKEKLEQVKPLSSDRFPFGQYLSVSVRLCTDDILQFTWGFWLSAWLTFGAFVLLHRFAHMAYVRIMFFFALLLVIVMLGMHFVVMATTKSMEQCNDIDEDEESEEGEPKLLPFTHWISLLLQFTLFFLCYGFVRMVTAPWLWKIYFYNVLALTCIFAISMLAFIMYLAPLIPAFYAAMSIPPHISESDVDTIVKSLQLQHDYRHLSLTPCSHSGKAQVPA